MRQFLDQLERRLGRLAIPSLPLYLIGAQFIVFIFIWFERLPPEYIWLDPQAFLAGEVWRAFTFVLMPPFIPAKGAIFGMIFLAFAWYLFWIMTTALENLWGAFRLNLFIYVWIVATVAAVVAGELFFGGSLPVMQTSYLGASVFLAFAILYPDFELLLFFVLPVKIKWLALLTWIILGLSLITGPMSARLVVLATVLNVFLFFGKSVFRSFQWRQRRKSYEKQTRSTQAEAFHRCHLCGRTDKTHPDKDFRYKQEEGESRCYCADYLQTGKECAD